MRRLCEVAFGSVGLNWEDYVYVNPDDLRPAEVDLLVGDASKARRELGWAPTVTFEQMIEMMVEADLEALRSQRQPMRL